MSNRWTPASAIVRRNALYTFALPGDQFAALRCHIREGTESVVFQIEKPVDIVEGRVQAGHQGHVGEAGERQPALILTVAGSRVLSRSTRPASTRYRC